MSSSYKFVLLYDDDDRQQAFEFASNPTRLDHLGLRRVEPSREGPDAAETYMSIMAGVQAAHASQSATYRARLLATGDARLVEQANRGMGGPWTGGPRGGAFPPPESLVDVPERVSVVYLKLVFIRQTGYAKQTAEYTRQ